MLHDIVECIVHRTVEDMDVSVAASMFTGRVAFHVNKENILDSIFVAALWTLK